MDLKTRSGKWFSMKDSKKDGYLVCEQKTVYALLMASAGMMGAYTYLLRGGVFCNAQTANVLVMGMSFGKGDWTGGLYYLIPFAAYLLGAFVSEILPSPVKKLGFLRWDTYLIIVETAALFLLGFVPLTVPHQIVQVIINFLASMQYNTFRQAEGIPMATTFCTNHLRQTGALASRAIRHHDREAARRMVSHFRMLLSFVLGGVAAAVLCRYFLGKALLFTLLPLGYLLAKFLLEDIRAGKDLLARKPAGH